MDSAARAVAGAVGGISAMTLLYPFDNIRTRLQNEVVVRSTPLSPPVQRYPEKKGTNTPYSSAPFTPIPSSSYHRAFRTIINMINSQILRPFQCAKEVIQSEGWQALYNGLLSAQLGIGVSQLVYFFFYNLLKNFVEKRRRNKLGHRIPIGPIANMGIASVAGVLNVFATMPIWVVNARLTMQRRKIKSISSSSSSSSSSSPSPSPSPSPYPHTPTRTSRVHTKKYNDSKNGSCSNSNSNSNNCNSNNDSNNVSLGSNDTKSSTNQHDIQEQQRPVQVEEYGGILDAMRKIYKSQGLAGLYKGLVPSLILVSNPAIQFVAYEQLTRYVSRRSRLSPSRRSVELSAAQYFWLGAIAKFIATCATYPYQVLKARMQAKDCPYNNTRDAIRTIYQKEGLIAFFQGMGAKMSQTVLNSAFMFLIYEKLYRLILACLNLLLKRRLGSLLANLFYKTKNLPPSTTKYI